MQRATLEGLSAEAVSTTVWTAGDALVQVWAEIERDTESSRALRDCATSLRERHGASLWNPDAHAVLFRASLGERGLVGAAVDYCTQMLSRATAALGPDHPSTLNTRYNLAWWRGEAGDHASAAAAFKQPALSRIRSRGDEPPLRWVRAAVGNALDPSGDDRDGAEPPTFCFSDLGKTVRSIPKISQCWPTMCRKQQKLGRTNLN